MSVCVHMKYHSQQTKQQNMMSHLFWEPLLTSLPPTRGYVCVCIIFFIFSAELMMLWVSVKRTQKQLIRMA